MGHEMTRSPLLVKHYQLLLLLPVLAILVGLFLVTGEAIPLFIGYEGPSTTVELDSVWDIVGLAIVASAIIVIIWMRQKHKEALARILQEGGRATTLEKEPSDDDSNDTQSSQEI